LKEVNLTLAIAVSVDIEKFPNTVSRRSITNVTGLLPSPSCTETQVVLALKYVANLKVESIALQLGEGFDSIEKMLYRARQKIKSNALILSSTNEVSSEGRLSIVHKVIY